MKKANILVVEDEPIIAMDIRRRLLHLGYGVTAIADSGEAAIDAILQNVPNLILMDIHLIGDMDGIQVAAHVREKFGLPVIFLTAHADEATLEQAKATQPFGYIVKPFENHDLKTAIEIALSRYEAELVMQRALAREKHLSELKSRFIAIASHEFRSPLASIQLTLEGLKDPKQILTSEKKLVRIQRAEAQIKRMTDLLEDILIIGEAEDGNFRCHPSMMNVATWCQELVEDFQNHQKKYSIMFEIVEEDAGCSKPSALDSKLLRHILTNLLSNAIKYSPENSQVRFELTCHPEVITFQVQDWGIGIPEVDQIDLFTPFHRGGNVHKFVGTGLGLSIVKQCVEVHGGTIALESKVGFGTTVTVKIPQSR
ncbi:histidine kinase [Tumidithrix helvetica PCC 7403]|uniref:hybrid sensor histidine kinase/response regulator n=1 Tax=Tumidithrix helvetica TaxID=3457545 RepID=UPI003C8D41C4